MDDDELEKDGMAFGVVTVPDASKPTSLVPLTGLLSEVIFFAFERMSCKAAASLRGMLGFAILYGQSMETTIH